MFAQERKNLILETLQQKKRVTIAELTDLLQVSGTTVRMYLTELEQQHKLLRTHGGAMWIDAGYGTEETMDARQGKDLPQKQAIARLAVQELNAKETIFLDTGTTCVQIAEELLYRKIPMTVVTNDVRVALTLQKSNVLQVVMLGGTLRNAYECTLGAGMIEEMERYYFDTALIAANGVSAEYGISTPHPETAQAKRAALKQAKRSIVVVDHTKLEKVTATKFADIHDVDEILTDPEASEQLLAQYQQQGIRIRKGE